MSKVHIALLAAAIGAGIPSLASAQMGDGRQGGGQRGDRGGWQRGDQGQGQGRNWGGGGGQFQTPQAPQPQQPPAAPQPPSFSGRDFSRNGDANGRFDGDRRGAANANRDWNGARPGQDDRRFGDGGRSGFESGRRGFAGDDRRSDNGFDRGDRRSFGNRDPRQGFAGNGYAGGERRFGYDRDVRRGDGRGQGWAGTNWRSDRRYDWRGWRDQHRETFRIGRYVPPRGYGSYGYRRFDIGFRLQPFFYASNYWIDDPYDYRLPPAYGPYRWVRYYDDVLLVDLETGEVVDVIHDFFW